MGTPQYIRKPIVSDSPAETQMQWASYLNSTRDPLPFQVWNERRLAAQKKTA